ncbi:MAG: ABC transporter ATP-binding protein [Thermoleophilia bacterium]
MSATLLEELSVPVATSYSGPLLQVRDLVKRFPITSGTIIQRTIGMVHAVEGVTFSISEGETLGLVGESGCGKTTTGRCILQLYKPTSGSILFEGKELTALDRDSMQHVRRDMQIVFQDPYASLNPRMTVGSIVGEPLTIHRIGTRAERKQRVRELLDLVGLNPSFTNRYPHQFSGGQRQRIGLARALALNPKLIICDEPVSALDVSIQAQILNLFDKLQQDLGLTYLFIAHNLSVVKHISDRVAVMYLGKIMEIAPSRELYASPVHPYTYGLLSAIPIPDPSVQKLREHVVLEGDVPSPVDPPSGCVFHPRCFRAKAICAQQVPQMEPHGQGHEAACFFPLDTSA